MRIWMLQLLVIMVPIAVFGQNTEYDSDTLPVSPVDQSKVYEILIKKNRINGVYIPKNIEDAMKEIDSKIDSIGKEKFKTLTEAESARKVYFSFGKWMAVNWSLERGSRLSHYLRSLGLTFTEDMVNLLSVCYHRHINSLPLSPDQYAAQLIKIRRDAYKARFKNGTVISKKKLEKISNIDTLHRE